MPWTIKELAEIGGGRVSRHPSAVITGFRAVEDAGEGDLTFVAGIHWLGLLKQGASAVAPPDLEAQAGDRPLIIAENPRLVFARILQAVAGLKRPPAGVDSRAVVDKSAKIGADVHIGPLAYLGEGAKVGDRSVILAGAHIGENAEIGADCIIYPQAYIGPGCRLGSRVTIGPGASIGYEGFGYQWDGTRHVKIPQVGIVVIEDDVEIGANSTVDRAMLGETRIGAGTKIDNLVMVAHNCKIGRNVIFAGQVGLSGSVTVEDGAILGGQVGVADGINIGAGVMIAAQGGVSKSISAGQKVGGMPAKKQTTWLREQAIINRLPDMLKKIRELEERIKKLEKGE